MSLLLFLSDCIIPMMFLVILAYGIEKKVALFDMFVLGAKDGLKVVIQIFPTILGLIVAVGIMRASGALDMLTGIIAPITEIIGLPKESVPLIFMRLISSSASTGILLDIFKQYGADSFTGRFVSVMMSCTETVFYTMSVYFLSVKITKTRYTLPAALIANFVGVAASLYITAFVFGR